VGPWVGVAPSARGRPLELCDVGSPSGLEKLLSCSLAWALERKGDLWSGMGTGPGAPQPLHYGNVAHRVLEKVFGSHVASPDEAAARAEAMFDGSVHVLAEALHLPDYTTKRAELRRGIVESAREVARIVEKTGARVHGLEVQLEGKLGRANVVGRTDLMLSGPDAIIDFKWGYTTYKDLLTTGTAFQLIAYAALAAAAAKGSALPEIAYLALQRQQLLGMRTSKLPGVRSFSNHSADDMLAGAVARIDERVTELASGMLEAPSAVEDLETGGLVAGRMTIAPKCRYCDLGALCGKRLRP